MIGEIGAAPLAIAFVAYALGGFVKGAVGFALPLIAVTGAASVLPAQTAVALVILPVLVTNLSQAFAQGVAPLRESFKRFRVLTLTTAATIALSAQLLPILDPKLFFALLGLVSGVGALAQLFGWRPSIPTAWRTPAEVVAGMIAGFFGGIAGVWGPPTILYLTALSLSKEDQVRAAGLVFLVGGLVLAPAHIVTGVLDRETGLLSLLMVAPALFGQWAGRRAQRHMDLALFRKLTLAVLLLVSLNLLRRALLG